MKRNKMRVMDIEKIDDIMIGRIINTALSYVFDYNENGVQEYYPYFKMRGLKNGIVRNVFLGLTFEAEDDVDALVYSDKNIDKVYAEFVETNHEWFGGLMDTYKECIEYEKSKVNLNSKLSSELMDAILIIKNVGHALSGLAFNYAKVLNQQIKANEYNEKVMESMSPEETAALNKKFLQSDLTAENISDMMMQKYLNSGIMESNKDKIIEAKNEKIRSLEEYKKLNEARNVLADK